MGYKNLQVEKKRQRGKETEREGNQWDIYRGERIINTRCDGSHRYREGGIPSVKLVDSRVPNQELFDLLNLLRRKPDDKFE